MSNYEIFWLVEIVAVTLLLYDAAVYEGRLLKFLRLWVRMIVRRKDRNDDNKAISNK
jgi:hypothetical protein